MPASLIRNITDLSVRRATAPPSRNIQDQPLTSSQDAKLGYQEDIRQNITTLTHSGAQTLDGLIQGLLYVPDISSTSPTCNAQQYDYIPQNVTRRAQLPPTNYNLIAIAPWFSVDCAAAYITATRFDPLRGLIFYRPNDNTTNKPPDVSSDVWQLPSQIDIKSSRYPVFALPGLVGQSMVKQLSLYSGSVNDVPHGAEIQQAYKPNPKDYVRIWTTLTMVPPKNTTPLWVYFLVVIGTLIIIFLAVSLTSHLIQRRRRISLRRRVESGEVDLEAMGIKRLAVPAAHVKDFPLYTYTSMPANMMTTPTSESLPRSTRSSRHGDSRTNSSERSFSAKTLRSKRSARTVEDQTIAGNFQPRCHICLEPHEDRVTIIRELPCHHIYHPICIDEFLTRNSSLCPMCKQSMLPAGYSPVITNGMVRREHAVRKLRQKVEFDDASSVESGETKLGGWRRRIFHRRQASGRSDDYDLDVVDPDKDSPASSSNEPSSPSDAGQGDEGEQPAATGKTAPAPTPAPGPATAAASTPATTSETAAAPKTQKPSSSKKQRSRTSRPRAISVLPTQPEEGVPKTTGWFGRHSPSSFARERMKEMADRNAPFEDPDASRPGWQRAVNKVFPGLV